MVSLMENVSFGGEAYWGCQTLEPSDLSDFTYGQQMQRIQQEEQYRQEMMRQRQELHRRQMDLYQRLQVPQYLSQDSHTVVSTWINPLHQSPNLPSENSLFGSAPVVRNPTNSSIKDILSPLTVDCSVEYELPEFLKVSTKEGPPLLMIQNQRNETSCPQQPCSLPCEANSSSWTPTILAKEPVTHLPATGSSLKLFKSPRLNKSQSGNLELTAKLAFKRKFQDVRNQDIVHGVKKQKMTALTPPDLASVAHLLETPNLYFHPHRQSITQSHKFLAQSHTPTIQTHIPTIQSHNLTIQSQTPTIQSHTFAIQSHNPGLQSQNSIMQSHIMPELCSITNRHTLHTARNANRHSARTTNQNIVSTINQHTVSAINQHTVSATNQHTISTSNQQPATTSRISRTIGSMPNPGFAYPSFSRIHPGTVMYQDVVPNSGNYHPTPAMYQSVLPIKTTVFHKQMFQRPSQVFQKPIDETFHLPETNYNYHVQDPANYLYPDYKLSGTCAGCGMCRLLS